MVDEPLSLKEPKAAPSIIKYFFVKLWVLCAFVVQTFKH